MRSNPELLNAAEYAFDGGMESPWLATSPLDAAHHAGLWARSKGIVPKELREGRGYKMILNRDLILDFKRDNKYPDVRRKP